MSTILYDIIAANRAAITKLIPRAARLGHTVCDTDAERQAQLREMAESIYIAERAERDGAIRWLWCDEDDSYDWGDCEPMADGTYEHNRLHLISLDKRDVKVDVIDSLGDIIVPHKGAARTRQQYQDEMAVENRDAIAAAWLTLEATIASKA